MHAERQPDLFGSDDAALPPANDPLPLAEGACVLRAFATAAAPALFEALHAVLAAAPWRHMVVPGGRRMSVAMSNAGALGWVSDARGYRYAPVDPLSGAPWPAMPPPFARLAYDAAARAGFDGFMPDACLVNRYVPGARLSLHQDRDECDFTQPIVSVSLGLPATFLFGGPKRTDPTRRVPLRHGDVVVWGGPARLHFHGVLPLADGVPPVADGVPPVADGVPPLAAGMPLPADGEHPGTGRCRINLTFRRAA